MNTSLVKLRQKYPTFTYQDFSYELVPDGLKLTFEFTTEPDLHFRPSTIIKGITEAKLAQIPLPDLHQYLFHIGLVEMLSYWKATCSPHIKIAAGPLTDAQLEWWQSLLIKGMGEYFFVNDIDFTASDFVTLTAEPTNHNRAFAPAPHTTWTVPEFDPTAHSVMIPIGGGKDSALSIETLKQAFPELKTNYFIITSSLAQQEIAALTPQVPVWTIDRELDPLLAELNEQGYLNGHTPLSALAAFLLVFVGRLAGTSLIAVSNERSSNEGNVWFHGHEINHQYSKTYEFEKLFQTYVAEHLPASPFYFSLLRPLFELQIGQAFAQSLEANPPLATRFKSCNRGVKTNTWCGECPKCLFAYIVLYPFMPHDKVVAIFGSDLFENIELLPIALELLGKKEKKPLECVGTHEENIAAFYLSTQKRQATGQPLPPLLAQIHDQVLQTEPNLKERAATVLSSWNDQHSIPGQLEETIRNLVVPSP